MNFVKTLNYAHGKPICAAEHCKFFVIKGEDCLRNEVTSSAASQKIETHRGVGRANQAAGAALGC